MLLYTPVVLNVNQLNDVIVANLLKKKKTFGLQEERHALRAFRTRHYEGIENVRIFISYCNASEAFALIIY